MGTSPSPSSNPNSSLFRQRQSQRRPHPPSSLTPYPILRYQLSSPHPPHPPNPPHSPGPSRPPRPPNRDSRHGLQTVLDNARTAASSIRPSGAGHCAMPVRCGREREGRIGRSRCFSPGGGEPRVRQHPRPRSRHRSRRRRPLRLRLRLTRRHCRTNRDMIHQVVPPIRQAEGGS